MKNYKKLRRAYKVESGNWYTLVKLPNNTEESQEHQASEAATIGVSKFFTGAVKVTDLNAPHTFGDLIKVTVNNKLLKPSRREYLFYAPKILANAGWHEEAGLLHKRMCARLKKHGAGLNVDGQIDKYL